MAKATEATAEVKAELNLDLALATKPRQKSDKPKTLWLGFSVNGDSQAIVRTALAKAGITDMSAYIKRLVLADLKSRLNGVK